MKRVVVLSLVFSLFAASAWASPPDPPKPSAPAIDLSTKAAGLTGMPAQPNRFEVTMARTEAARTQGKRSVWKSPWPYVVIGAVVAVVVVVANKNSSGGGGI